MADSGIAPGTPCVLVSQQGDTVNGSPSLITQLHPASQFIGLLAPEVRFRCSRYVTPKNEL